MKKINQKGFAALEVVLIIVVVLVLAVTGYYVYRMHHKTQSATSDTASNQKASSASQKSNSSSSSTATTVDDTGYLVIKEWGIKLKLADADKLTYTMNGTPNGPSNGDATTSYATLQFNSSVDVPATCKDGKNIGISVSQLTSATNATKVGNYYYGFDGSVNTCGDNTTDALKQKIAGQELVLSAISAE